MNAEQDAFYCFLAKEIDHHHYPNVEGNLSYLFAYVYLLMSQWRRRGFEWIHVILLELIQAYHTEPRFTSFCNGWSMDCLLGRRMYEEYLLATEREDIFSGSPNDSNMRCNVFYLLGNPATGVDLLYLSGASVTSFTRKYSAVFRDFLEIAFAEDAKSNGPWLDRLLEAQTGRNGRKTYGFYLFSGAPIDQPPVPFSCYCFYAAYAYMDVIRQVVRLAENRLRESFSVPKVGEGWLAETELFHAIRKRFPETVVVQHGRPTWLGRQHLDIWIPTWKIAVEYHGGQHFAPVTFFGGEEAFKAGVKRDGLKRRLCARHGVKLIIATEETSSTVVIEEIIRVRSETSEI